MLTLRPAILTSMTMLNAATLFVIVVYFITAGIRTVSAMSLTDFNNVLCFKPKLPLENLCPPKRRRYDVSNFGAGEQFYHSWVDVQGQGASNDYCRIVGTTPNFWLSCALAGTHGQSDTNYNSSKTDFDVGLPNTWYMKDVDEDGRDDYCRCVGDDKIGYRITCTKAGIRGFSGSIEEGGKTNSFDIPLSTNCKNKELRPEFGLEHIIPNYPQLWNG